jgi:hypothetical protein
MVLRGVPIDTIVIRLLRDGSCRSDSCLLIVLLEVGDEDLVRDAFARECINLW